MPRPYSKDLRLRAVWLQSLQRKTIQETAKALYISESSVKRYNRREKLTCDVGHWLQRHGPRETLHIHEKFLLMETLLRKPSMYLDELAQLLQDLTGRVTSESTVSRALRKLPFTRKKLLRVALQRSEIIRERFRTSTRVYSREMFIFLVESGFDRRNGMRQFGYSWEGSRARERRELVRGTRINSIAAMSSRGVLDVELFEGSICGERFVQFLRRSLLPHLMPFDGVNCHSVVIMDNASIHRVSAVEDLLRGVGVVVRYLPPYSPDLNPIEEVFSKVKYVMRRSDNGMSTDERRREAILSAFNCVTSSDCQGYITHSGYN